MMTAAERQDRWSVVARAVVVGAAASGVASLLDFASDVLWLSSPHEQLRLAFVVAAIGVGFGATVGGALAGYYTLPFGSRARRTAVLVAIPLGYVAYALFLGGHARRIPALWLVQPCVWLALVWITSAGIEAGCRVLDAVRLRPVYLRALTCSCFVVAGLVMHALDHRYLPRLYEYLHAALGIGTAVSFAGAIASLPVRPLGARAARQLAMAALLQSAVTLPLAFASLERWENVRAELFGVHTPYTHHIVAAAQWVRSRDVPSLPSRRAHFLALDATRTPPDDRSLPSAPGAHLLLITIDAMRADRLGRGALTPNLDALAARGVTFVRTYSQAPHSSYSLSSLHTSEYLHETVPLGQPQPLGTIANSLTDRGYRTAALFTQGIFFTEGEQLRAYRDRSFGFARADHVDRRAQAQAQAAMLEIDETVRRGEPPTFLWVHFFDAHEPYGGDGATPIERYDNAIHRVDAAVGQLLAYADAHLARDVVIAVTADHGEEFGEHGGVYHGSTLYEEQVRVPLIVVAPQVRPTRVVQTAELVDLAPTLLALLGVRPPATMRGRDLRPAMTGSPANALSALAFAGVNTRRMAVNWPYKLITDLRYDVRELYDLANDGGETSNLVGTEPRRVTDLEGALSAWIDALGESAAGRSEIARGQLGDRSVIPALLRVAADRTLPVATRCDAIDALAAFVDAAVVEPLRPLLHDPDCSIANRAAIALATRPDAGVRSQLYIALTTGTLDERGRAAVALARLGDTAALPALLDALYNADEPLRLLAVDALGALGSRDALEGLMDALSDDHLRYRAVLSLGETRAPETFDTLVQLAENDRHDEVRANSLAALALLGDHRAVPLIAGAATRGTQMYAGSALGRLGAVGREVDGWDARAPGAGWSRCEDVDDGPTWRRLGARACVADGHAVVPLGHGLVPFGHGRREAGTLVIRVRGEGTLAVSGRGEIARVPLGSSWREWRFALASDEPSAVTLDAAAEFEVQYVLWVEGR